MDTTIKPQSLIIIVIAVIALLHWLDKNFSSSRDDPSEASSISQVEKGSR
ncbi:MAG: hypothetical protein AAGD22_00620 [Verrucomicrobiota bacterium]